MSATAAGRKALFDIEREKRWRIWLLFGLLLAVIFVTVWGVCVIVSVGLYVSFPVVNVAGWVFTLQGIAIVLAVSLAASLLYWFASRLGARDRLLRAMHCEPLDPGDRYHQRLANVVEEMRIATGAHQVECVTVRTLGLNAFAFSDLRGGGVVGVTEGALARLSRNQLQGVVAHEFGHVLSGSYVTVTVSCLLFGIYSAAGERLEEAAVSVGSTRAAPLGLLAVGVRGWLWLMQLASSVTSAALSRERERQADLAAAHYTRDPLSLAEALRVISRHPGGAGYIPEGLAPLCIRDTQPLGKRLFGEWRSTHPPLEERVQVLLALAAASPEEFARQADTAAERFTQREHWETQPATGRASAAATMVGASPPAPSPAVVGPAGAGLGAGAATVAPLVAPPLGPAVRLLERPRLGVVPQGPGRRGRAAEGRGLPVLRSVTGHRGVRGSGHHGVSGVRRAAGDARRGRQAARPSRGGLHRTPAAARRSPGHERGRAAPGCAPGARPTRGAADPLPALRQDHDAPPLRLRARRGGRLLRYLRPLLVREGRARGAAAAGRAPDGLSCAARPASPRGRDDTGTTLQYTGAPAPCLRKASPPGPGTARAGTGRRRTHRLDGPRHTGLHRGLLLLAA